MTLFFAFDDPSSAVAVIDLAERIGGPDVRLSLAPVVRRGIPDDPAVQEKRRHAIDDARRLFARTGLVLRRTEPVPAEDVAFLAAWAASAPAGPARTRFCVAACRRLWLSGDGPVRPADYAALWRGVFGAEPPADGDLEQVRQNERRMRRRGPYDTPAALVHGQWFFAHDRLPQIADRLHDLGWHRTAA